MSADVTTREDGRAQVGAEGSLIVPTRSRVVVQLGAAAIWVALGLMLLVFALTSSYRRWTCLAVGICLVIGYGTPFLQMLAEALRLRPIGRMDAAGIEAAFGRLLWPDVNSITVQWRWTRIGGHRRVVLAADPAKVFPATRSWSHFLVSEATSGIALPLWGRREDVLAELRRWYLGPIDL